MNLEQTVRKFSTHSSIVKNIGINGDPRFTARLNDEIFKGYIINSTSQDTKNREISNLIRNVILQMSYRTHRTNLRIIGKAGDNYLAIATSKLTPEQNLFSPEDASKVINHDSNIYYALISDYDNQSLTPQITLFKNREKKTSRLKINTNNPKEERILSEIVRRSFPGTFILVKPSNGHYSPILNFKKKHEAYDKNEEKIITTCENFERGNVLYNLPIISLNTNPQNSIQGLGFIRYKQGYKPVIVPNFNPSLLGSYIHELKILHDKKRVIIAIDTKPNYQVNTINQI